MYGKRGEGGSVVWERGEGICSWQSQPSCPRPLHLPPVQLYNRKDPSTLLLLDLLPTLGLEVSCTVYTTPNLS